MKTKFYLLLPSALMLLGLNSCVVPAGPPYAGGYPQGGYAQNTGYNDGGYYTGGNYDGGGYGDDDEVGYFDSYGHYSAVYVPGYYRTYVRYDRYGHRDPHGYYDRHGRDVRTRGHSSHRNDVHHSSSYDHHRSNSSSSATLYSHTSARSNPGAPQGQHPLSWYKSHGYSPSRLAPATSNSSHSSSSHKKKHDDDRR